MSQFVPRPVQVIVVLHLAAALIFGVVAQADPSVQFPDLVENVDADFAVDLYANRNIGIGLALLGALLIASRWALIGLMAARLVTDLADLASSFGRTEGGAIVGQLVFFAVLVASELFVIRSLVQLERAAVVEESS